jgi:hypothetical protein
MTWMEWYNSLAKPTWTPAPSTISLIWVCSPITIVHWDDYPATRAAVQTFFCDDARTPLESNFPDAEIKKREIASEQRFCNGE